MAETQDRAGADGRQALRCQIDHLRHLIGTHIAHALDTRLEDLPEIPGIPPLAVDILPVIDLPNLAGLLRGILDDGEGHIGLHGEQAAVRAGEGDDPVGEQEVLVSYI